MRFRDHFSRLTSWPSIKDLSSSIKRYLSQFIISITDKWSITRVVLKKGSDIARLSQIRIALALDQGFRTYSIYFGSLRQQRTPYQRYHHELRRGCPGWAHENYAPNNIKIRPSKPDHTQSAKWEQPDFILSIID